MTTQHAAFVGSIPRNYDRYLGPTLFEPYAADLVDRVSIPSGGSLLEIACGTGIVTRRLRDRLTESARITATDLNEAMIAYARQKFRSDENVEWKQADATDLPFPDQSFETVVCQFGLMFVPDKARVASEAFRVLKPGGKFHFSVWDALERNDLAHAAHTTVAKYFDNDPPDFYKVPFSWCDLEEVHALFATAGFDEIQLTPLAFPCIAASSRDAAAGLIHGNPIIGALRERCESRIPEIEADLAATIAAKYGDGPVQAKMRAFVCSAVRQA